MHLHLRHPTKHVSEHRERKSHFTSGCRPRDGLTSRKSCCASRGDRLASFASFSLEWRALLLLLLADSLPSLPFELLLATNMPSRQTTANTAKLHRARTRRLSGRRSTTRHTRLAGCAAPSSRNRTPARNCLVSTRITGVDNSREQLTADFDDAPADEAVRVERHREQNRRHSRLQTLIRGLHAGVHVRRNITEERQRTSSRSGPSWTRMSRARAAAPLSVTRAISCPVRNR